MTRINHEKNALKLAKLAAEKRKMPPAKLSWSQALAEAPLPVNIFPAWEATFRKAYAHALVALDHAKKAAASGKSGGGGGVPVLKHRKVYQTQEEFDEQDVQAKAKQLPWSTWARRKLSQ